MNAAVPALRLRNLSKTFGTKTVLRDVDLDVAKGETVVIIGASGGSAPEWFDTSRAPPSVGTFSTSSCSTRNQ